MEVLIRLLCEQDDFEDALRMESTPEECCSTKEGKILLRWIRSRRKAIEKFESKFVRKFG
jgi:hypothetical protein